jgi:hypothetical protein
MKESPEQYAARLSSYVAGKNHIGVLKRTPDRLTALLKRVSRAHLVRRPHPDRWSVAEILAHLAEAEIAMGYRLRLVVSAPGTPVQAYDQNLWQNNAGYLLRDPRKTLRTFAVLREMNLAFVQTLDADKLDRYGIHAERGRESILKMIELIAGHDQNHLTQIKAILKGKTK